MRTQWLRVDRYLDRFAGGSRVGRRHGVISSTELVMLINKRVAMFDACALCLRRAMFGNSLVTSTRNIAALYWHFWIIGRTMPWRLMVFETIVVSIIMSICVHWKKTSECSAIHGPVGAQVESPPCVVRHHSSRIDSYRRYQYLSSRSHYIGE